MAEQSKVLLIAQLDKARSNMAQSASELRHDLDLPQHLRNTYVNHKGAWIGGAAALGWVMSRLPGRRKKYKERVSHNGRHNGATEEQIKKYTWGGILLTILRFVFNALQPAMTAVASRKIKEMAKERIRF